MNTQTQNAAPEISSCFDAGIDEKLDILRPRFERMLRELLRLCMDWSGDVPKTCGVCHDEWDLFAH
jgi:hypothetical protein